MRYRVEQPKPRTLLCLVVCPGEDPHPQCGITNVREEKEGESRRKNIERRAVVSARPPDYAAHLTASM